MSFGDRSSGKWQSLAGAGSLAQEVCEMLYFCCDQRRRNAVLASSLNGIDYLEVLDSDAPSPADRQLILLVHLLKVPTGITLTPDHLRIQGGDRIPHIQVTQVTTFPDSTVVQVRVNQWGDYSPYTLQFVRSKSEPLPPVWIDPVLSTIQFSFKVECPTDFDCQTERFCPPEVPSLPEINYLAKDYASFRQLMLDRLSVLMPKWRERHPADMGIALVELLAYVGDDLSYQQDAIATEAYLGTARRRTSVRRHARLVDYLMHDGCNARVWVQIQVSGDAVLPKGTPLMTKVAGQPPLIAPQSSIWMQSGRQGATIFETMEIAPLFVRHNEIEFYTWGSQECCLPQGSTRATLKDHYPNLKAGMVLLFEEKLGAKTGQPEDADQTHRLAVRLTRVDLTTDPIGGQFANPPNPDPVEVTEIAWAIADALPFALCISARTDLDHQAQYHDKVSVALGNIVLADHGMTVAQEPLESVPKPHLFRVPMAVGDRCAATPVNPVPPRFRPTLQQSPLTHAAPYSPQKSAQSALQWEIQKTLPAIVLNGTLGQNSIPWQPQRDLLSSNPTSPEFVVETETDGIVYLRFGDNQYGLRPSSGTQFNATYRVGNGVAGNIGAEMLRHAVSTESAIAQVRNPLAAVGGVDPETLEEVRQLAPYAFRIQERAVTAEDYAEVTERHPDVQKAAATFRWTGSWRTVFVTIDRQGGLPVDAPFKAQIRQFLERYRMAGYDLEIDAPRFVSLEIEMQVCVKPNYFRSQVKAALLQVFSDRALPDGRLGVFHPDSFTFGQPVYLSPLYAAAQAIDGVSSVQITVFQRQGQPDGLAIAQGKLELNRLEIARLSNDPDFPERGVLKLTLAGGK
ncbi:MAG: putative baseplate assembly protein [Nostoc sp.]